MQSNYCLVGIHPIVVYTTKLPPLKESFETHYEQCRNRVTTADPDDLVTRIAIQVRPGFDLHVTWLAKTKVRVRICAISIL